MIHESRKYRSENRECITNSTSKATTDFEFNENHFDNLKFTALIDIKTRSLFLDHLRSFRMETGQNLMRLLEIPKRLIFQTRSLLLTFSHTEPVLLLR